MTNRSHEEDQQLSELTNSFLFMVLLIAVTIWAGYNIYRRQVDQQACRARGGYVEELPGEPEFSPHWQCRMEDRD